MNQGLSSNVFKSSRWALNCKLLGLLLVGTTCVTSCGSHKRVSGQLALGTQEKDPPVYVRVPKSFLTQDWVAQTGFNRDHGGTNQFALGYMPQDQLSALSPDEKRQIDVLNAFDVATGQLDIETLAPMVLKESTGTSRYNYHNYVDMTQDLKTLASQHTDLIELESVGKSVKSRDLWLMRISGHIARKDPKPKFLYIANMHGDEVIGRELAILFLHQLAEGYGHDQRITKLLDNAEIFVIPSMNPDGYELKQRYNANYADLNRSFPDFTSDPTDAPASRPIEVAAIMALHQKHHFVAAINYHGGAVCFNLPWDTKPNQVDGDKFGDDALMFKLGRSFADKNPTMSANSEFDRGLTYGYEWYEVNGGMQDWANYYRRSMHATVELSYVKWPASSQIEIAWQENKESMLGYMEQSLIGIHMHVVDQEGHDIPNAVVSVDSSNRNLAFDTAFISRPTLAGARTVTVTANGFKSATITMEAAPFNGHFATVTLSH
jgi:hypothetical protein